MICTGCAFQTRRLTVSDWCSPVERRHDRVAIVSSLLTVETTRALPADWQGSYTADRASSWIGERDAEGVTLLVVERSTDRPVGLTILFESGVDDDSDDVEVRLGYVLSESVWGRGLAGELVEGFVAWCGGRQGIRRIAAGVSDSNPASARVLHRNGFVPTSPSSDDGHQIYELVITR